EGQVRRPPMPGGVHELAWRDLGPVLDEEVLRLPARCRVPLVLCYLEGRTTEEAAALLGCPRGTVLSRLARARELLRGRLLRRGVGLSGALLATLLPQGAAAVPAGPAGRSRRLRPGSPCSRKGCPERCSSPESEPTPPWS